MEKINATEYWWISHKLDPGRLMLVRVVTEGEDLKIVSPGNENKGAIESVLHWVKQVKPPYKEFKEMQDGQ